MNVKTMHPPLVATLLVLIIVLLVAAPGLGLLVLIGAVVMHRRQLSSNRAYEARRKATWGF